jgi:chromosome segregation ATPase
VYFMSSIVKKRNAVGIDLKPLQDQIATTEIKLDGLQGHVSGLEESLVENLDYDAIQQKVLEKLEDIDTSIVAKVDALDKDVSATVSKVEAAEKAAAEATSTAQGAATTAGQAMAAAGAAASDASKAQSAADKAAAEAATVAANLSQAVADFSDDLRNAEFNFAQLEEKGYLTPQG